MTTELASDPLLEIALSIHGSTKCLYQNYVDDSGTAGMFTIVQETTFDAARLEGVLVHFNDVIESGEQVLAEERESLGQTLINHLAAVCAGEYFFHSNSPDIMKLSQEVLLLWPGQPLRNFGHSGPVLEGAYWFVNSVRKRCTREIAAFGQFIAGDEDVPRQLAEGLDRLIENIPRGQQFRTFVSEEEYCQSESAVARLQDLYQASHRYDGVDNRKFDVRPPRLTPTEERIVNFVKESEQPPRAEDIACGLRLNNNSHFRGSLSNLVRLEVLAHAQTGGYILGCRALMSGQKSGSKSGQSQD